MHEEALLRDIVAKVDEVARRGGGRPVTRIRLRVGALSHLTAAWLVERWPLAARGTLGEGAVVEVSSSSDPTDPQAQSVLVESIDVADPAGGR